MNKSDLIDAVAGDADISKASAGRAVDAVLGGIGDALGTESPLPKACLLYTSPSPRDGLLSRMPSSA